MGVGREVKMLPYPLLQFHALKLTIFSGKVVIEVELANLAEISAKH